MASLVCFSIICFALLALAESSFHAPVTNRACQIPLRERLKTCRWATSHETTARPATVVPEKRKRFVGATTATARSVAASVFFKQKGNEEFILARLDADPAFRLLDQRDKAFARLLVTTVERRLGQIDKVLAVCSNLEGKKHVSLKS
jgi:hypothetical protein